MNKKLLNQIYNIIFYSFAICSAGYFIISSIQKNEGLKSSDIIYICNCTVNPKEKNQI